ncbi:MAG TPA: hypothetical protein VGJ63_16690 [Micromonosporaceae bacterium]
MDTGRQVDDRTSDHDRRTSDYDSRLESETTQLDDRPDRADTAADRAAALHTADEAEAERTAEAVPEVRRPRASGLAMFGLILGVAGALFVLSGTLAGYGIALGALAVLCSLGGMSATSRFHVAGRTDAMLGLLLGLGAVVIGILAVTGTLSWLSPDTDRVGWLRNWLDTNTVNRF